MKPACFGTASTNCLADMSKGYPCWQKEGCAKETRRRWIWKLYKEEHLDVGAARVGDSKGGTAPEFLG